MGTSRVGGGAIGSVDGRQLPSKAAWRMGDAAGTDGTIGCTGAAAGRAAAVRSITGMPPFGRGESVGGRVARPLPIAVPASNEVGP